MALTASLEIKFFWSDRRKSWDIVCQVNGRVYRSLSVDSQVPVSASMIEGVARAIRTELEAQLPL